jgi:hypothetical protein
MNRKSAAPPFARGRRSFYRGFSEARWRSRASRFASVLSADWRTLRAADRGLGRRTESGAGYGSCGRTKLKSLIDAGPQPPHE